MIFKTLKSRGTGSITNFAKTGIRFDTKNYNNKLYMLYSRKTCATLNKWIKCKECGVWFTSIKKNQVCCCTECGAKYRGRKMKEKYLRQTFKVINEKDIKEWCKKFNNYAIAEIYKYDRQLTEDMLDRYHELLPRLVYLLRNSTNKGTIAYLNKTIRGIHATVLKKKKNEVSYYDCNMATQMKILGEYYGE